MTDTILSLQLRLLILRHGRRRVIEALANLTEQSTEVLEGRIAQLEEHRARRTSRTLSAVDFVEEACKDRPDIAELVGVLASRFDDRSFLPYLRDVERFLDRVRVTHGRLKSRPAAAGYVIKALGKFTREQLGRLVSSSEGHQESKHAILAREITGNRSTPLNRRSEESAPKDHGTD